jgi:molecular chaperone GrpE
VTQNQNKHDNQGSTNEGQSPQGAVPRTPADATNGPVTEADGQELENRVAAAEARADEHLKDLQRLAAEFDNYRKRVVRDQELSSARAREQVVKDLLPVVDDLERALEAAEQHEEAKLEEGVRLVHRALQDVLRRQGLEEIDANGRFDPHVHEALLAQPSDQEEGSVIQVAQKGYRLGDLVLRPARVVVSAGPDQETNG